MASAGMRSFALKDTAYDTVQNSPCLLYSGHDSRRANRVTGNPLFFTPGNECWRHALRREPIHWIASVGVSSSTRQHALRFSRGWFLGRFDTHVIQAYMLAVHINWVRHAYLAM